MANNYVGCAFEFEMPSVAAGTYALHVAQAHNLRCEDKSDEQIAEALGINIGSVPPAPEALKYWVNEEIQLPTTIDYEPVPDSDRVSIYINVEDCDIEAVVSWLEHLVEKYDDMKPVGFSWANWCDKPRPGEFGGGAVYIRKGDTKHLGTDLWLGNQYEIDNP